MYITACGLLVIVQRPETVPFYGLATHWENWWQLWIYFWGEIELKTPWKFNLQNVIKITHNLWLLSKWFWNECKRVQKHFLFTDPKFDSWTKGVKSSNKRCQKVKFHALTHNVTYLATVCLDNVSKSDQNCDVLMQWVSCQKQCNLGTSWYF